MIVSLLLIPALYMVLDTAVRWVRNRREVRVALPEAEGIAEGTDGE